MRGGCCGGGSLGSKLAVAYRPRFLRRFVPAPAVEAAAGRAGQGRTTARQWSRDRVATRCRGAIGGVWQQ